MSREDILIEAKKIVCNDRNQQYGEPEDNFKAIAALWSAYLGIHMTAKDVALMMVLFKIARATTSVHEKDDTYIDICGYAACAGEITTNKGENQ